MDSPELPKRHLKLYEVFITAAVMVAVTWAWNTLVDAFGTASRSQTQIEDGRAARNRELDLLEGRVARLEATDVEILKLLSDRSKQ